MSTMSSFDLTFDRSLKSSPRKRSVKSRDPKSPCNYIGVSTTPDYTTRRTSTPVRRDDDSGCYTSSFVLSPEVTSHIPHHTVRPRCSELPDVDISSISPVERDTRTDHLDPISRNDSDVVDSKAWEIFNIPAPSNMQLSDKDPKSTFPRYILSNSEPTLPRYVQANSESTFPRDDQDNTEPTIPRYIQDNTEPTIPRCFQDNTAPTIPRYIQDNSEPTIPRYISDYRYSAAAPAETQTYMNTVHAKVNRELFHPRYFPTSYSNDSYCLWPSFPDHLPQGWFP